MLVVLCSVRPAAATCGDGVVDPGEYCDTAIPSGSAGACATQADCDAMSHNGCPYILAGSSCQVACIRGPSDNCYPNGSGGSGSGSGSEPTDDGSCAAGGTPGLLAGLLVALAAVIARRRRPS